MILFQIVVGLIVTLVVIICYILAIAFTVWMAIDAGKQDRFWWLAVIIGVPLIGPAVYYITEKKHQYRQAPIHNIHTSLTEKQHEVAPKKRVVRKSKASIKQVIKEESGVPTVETGEGLIEEKVA